MLVLKLCQEKCPQLIPVVIGDKLGTDGADGEVFDIIGQPDKVIKFCLLLENQVESPKTLEDSYFNIKEVLEYLITNSVDGFAKVYSYDWLGEYSRTVWGNTQEKYFLYYYIMEKLYRTTGDERKVFHSILSHEDRGIIKNYGPEQIKKMLAGLSRGLDFDAEKVMLFCDKVRQSPVIHLDVEVRNIMKDISGQFKLIDFDRAMLRRK